MARHDETAVVSTVASPFDQVPASAEGTLVVTSNPRGARVTVNGIGWGSTPITIRHVPLGDKRIRLSKQGYRTAERAIALTRDQAAQSISITLTEE